MKLNIIKKYWGYVLAIVLSVGLSLLINENRKVKLAYVDSVKVLLEYEPLQKVRDELSKKNDDRNARIDTLASRLQMDIMLYERDRNRLNKEDREYRENIIAKQRRDLIQFRQAMEAEQKEEEKQMTIQAIEPVEKIIKDYARDKGYDFVFNASGNILYVNEATDITEEIIRCIKK